MLNKNILGVKKCETKQKQHCGYSYNSLQGTGIFTTMIGFVTHLYNSDVVQKVAK